MGLRKNYANFTDSQLITKIRRLQLQQKKQYLWHIENDSYDAAIESFRKIEKQMYYIAKEIRKRRIDRE